MNPRWMIYSHDALGLGHVRRGLAIARAVISSREDLATLLVTCSPVVDALPIPRGLDYIKLPSSRKVANGKYESRTLMVEPDRMRDLRSELLLQAATKYDPDLLLVDKTPGGLMGELEPALHALKQSGHTRLVLGWRDILDQRDTILDEWRLNGTLELIEEMYDEIWVYGDPSVFDVRTEYSLPDSIAARVRYMGYLCAPPSLTAVHQARTDVMENGGPLALVTVGGGEDGEALVDCYLETARRGLLPPELRSMIVLGPCMPPAAVARLQRKAPQGIIMRTFIKDLAPVIAAADVMVGMAGYNSSCEMLAGRTRAVLVPRVTQRKEQRMRAQRLADRGLCECLKPDELDAVSMAKAVKRALRKGPLEATALDMNGLREVANCVNRIVPARPAASWPGSTTARTSGLAS